MRRATRINLSTIKLAYLEVVQYSVGRPYSQSFSSRYRINSHRQCAWIGGSHFANDFISVRTRKDRSLARISKENLRPDAACGPVARAHISDSWNRVPPIVSFRRYVLRSDTSHDARSNLSLPRPVRGGYDYSAKVQ